MLDELEKLAVHYGVSISALETLARAVDTANGQAVHFSHPELGGKGQWIPGQVIIEDGSDPRLKAKIEALCEALIQIQTDTTTRPMAPILPQGFTWDLGKNGNVWWSEKLGEPNASGTLNNIGYAYFAVPNRLLIRYGSHTITYDTTPYLVNGISQRNRGGSSEIELNTSSGIISVNILKIVDRA